MTDTDLAARAFDRLLADEPPPRLALADVVAAGRRHRRRTTATRYATAAAVTSLAVAGTVVLPRLLDGDPPSRDAVRVAPVVAGGATAPAPAQPLTPRQQAVAAAIRRASPAGWTFDLAADRWEGLSVEATADDGRGPTRLMVGVTLGRGSQQLHPCRDDEFRQGATCDERVLADGSVLSVRGLAEHDGIATVTAVVTHPDGGGVMAESGNFTITWPLPRVVTPEQKRDLVRRVRTAPAYTAEQLAEIVLAVDRAARGGHPTG